MITDKGKMHAFERGHFRRGERGRMWPEETCEVCSRDPRSPIHSVTNCAVGTQPPGAALTAADDVKIVEQLVAELRSLTKVADKQRSVEDHDPGDEDRSVECYCSNCGDPFDDAAADAALGIPSTWRPCPHPSPGRPLVDCGVGGHMYVDTVQTAANRAPRATEPCPDQLCLAAGACGSWCWHRGRPSDCGEEIAMQLMTLDEIVARLEERRDHGPNDLHELVYQLARAVRDPKLSTTCVPSLDTSLCTRLIEAARGAERDWDAAAANEGRHHLPAAYVEGWNDALTTHARVLADQLEVAQKRVDSLESEVCALQDEATDLEEQRDIYRDRSRSLAKERRITRTGR